MTPQKNLKTTEDQEYWAFVERTVREVASWPEWMRGERSEQAKMGKETGSKEKRKVPQASKKRTESKSR